MESQVHSTGETIKRLNKQGEACMSLVHKDAPQLQKRLKDLNQGHQDLLKKAAERRMKLEEARDLFQFEVDMEEEEAWVIEKQRICQAGVTAKDIRAVMSLQQKHKVVLFLVIYPYPPCMIKLCLFNVARIFNIQKWAEAKFLRVVANLTSIYCT